MIDLKQLAKQLDEALDKETPETLNAFLAAQRQSEKPCPKCNGKGWFFVNEYIGSLQGRQDCNCKKRYT
ncbi:hypothetical protein SAMN05421780_11029 [Flexibacter flexilis DSM 6793]|uniref:Uncharacterized protein n=1 Tax=Flexibacter flexilis DSM 6793 TaxID=927664 RepID=A0A1I1M4L8_9BACT|nr:hypothetical protein [Flexibacter flexilis]SFC80331.1 hypothetical protein SAMN05421780_11029 [Flexibacter flexilis DSM 6793]